MSAASLFYYSSKVPLQTASSFLFTKDVSSSSAPKTRRVYRYEAIEAVAKGVQPYLSLCLETSCNSVDVDEPRFIPLLEKTSPNLSEGPLVHLKNPAIQSISTEERAKIVSPKRRLSSPDVELRTKPKPTEPGPRAIEDAIPKGEGKDLISWTDEDFDAMDYKNTPDYDPDQDDTEYGTTSDSEPESGTLMSENLKASREAIEFRQYIQLKVTMGGEEVQNSAFVQRSSSPSAAPRYLIVQEFSMLGSRGKDGRTKRKFGMNWELKRVEAKAWWRKKDRGGKGVRVGFYELLNKVEIDASKASGSPKARVQSAGDRGVDEETM
ncbi:hypothetical protein MMC22_010508 [Lobaria immixta]|nr:hypothetical protein [Lobaria immixta]